MKVTIPGKQLRAAVKDVASVSKPTEDRQILRNVLLTATDSGLEITATDTIVSLWVKLPIGPHLKVEQTGQAVVNAENFQRLLDTLLNKMVTLSSASRSFRVTAKGSRHKLAIEDPKEFPRIARFSSRKPFITVPADHVPKMIARTAFCAHDEASFQLMHGLLMKAKDGELRMVATNGQRLAITTMDYKQQSDSSIPFDEEHVIPAELAVAVKRIVSKETKTIDIQWTTSFVNFRTDVGEVSCRALSGKFPTYGRGIPTKTRRLSIDRREFIEILKQATAIKSPTTNFVSLTFEDKRMIFHRHAEGAGESEVEYAYEWGDEPLTVTVNPEFMLETLVAIRGEDIYLEVGSVMTPTIIREQDKINSEGLKSFCVYAVVRQ